MNFIIEVVVTDRFHCIGLGDGMAINIQQAVTRTNEDSVH